MEQVDLLVRLVGWHEVVAVPALDQQGEPVGQAAQVARLVGGEAGEVLADLPGCVVVIEPAHLHRQRRGVK